MLRLDRAAANVDRRAHHTLHLQQIQRHRHARDIRDGIRCAHLVKVHLLNRRLVNLRLRLAQFAKDRDRIPPHVGVHRPEQARRALDRARANRGVLDGDEHLAGLDDRLERVGVLRDDRQLQRGLAVVGAEAGGGVGDVRARRAADDGAAQAL